MISTTVAQLFYLSNGSDKFIVSTNWSMIRRKACIMGVGGLLAIKAEKHTVLIIIHTVDAFESKGERYDGKLYL